MRQILAKPEKEKLQLFQEAAARSTNIKSPLIIEKDIWVCWALDQIFKLSEINSHITFKGGTSLSKCYKIINRFSEDCDLTLNKEYLGIMDNANTISQKGSKQRKKSLENLRDAAIDKINDEIKPLLDRKFKKELADFYKDEEWHLETDPNDRQSLLLHYPSVFKNENEGYVQTIVKLEFGARGDNTPNEAKKISPYLYNIFSDLFQISSIIVQTLTAERTFWEKATLLHEEYYRKPDKPLRARMFRHYYDIVMLDKKGITEKALDDLQLLDTVLVNKQTYFASSYANYETAKIGTMRLLPHNNFLEQLRRDCENMADMFFGEAPNFDQIIQEVARIESKINFHQRKFN